MTLDSVCNLKMEFTPSLTKAVRVTNGGEQRKKGLASLFFFPPLGAQTTFLRGGVFYVGRGKCEPNPKIGTPSLVGLNGFYRL